MSVVGFDFGTTNSLVSVVKGDRVIRFLDDEQRPIPSVVCYEGAHKIVGRDAKERLAGAGLGIQGNIVSSPKRFLGQESIHVGGVERSPVDIVADVVRHVMQEARTGARRRDLEGITGAVVTIPVDMVGHRRRALRDAFRLAGLSIVQFVHEPLAALYGHFRGADFQEMLRTYDRKLILVFDWGGGTLDLTLCRMTGGMAVQVMNDGSEDVGGDFFDEAVMNHVVQETLRTRGIAQDVNVHPGARARLRYKCEQAKIALSSRSNAKVYLASYFQGLADEDLDYSLSRKELEDTVKPLLDNGFKRIQRILETAGYSPEQVALCVATGGMSNMPAVACRLNEWFGPERVRIPDGTATLIAEGAAWIAHDKAGLQLAKNVELALARNSYLPLVKAGTAMPREGEVQSESFHLYCTDPRDGTAKFELCSPKRAGRSVLPNDERTHLENVTVRVDRKARAFRERLELDIRINDDLVLEAHARSLNAQDQDRKEIHNLEFGLAFPAEIPPPPAERPGKPAAAASEPGPAGGVRVRANVADRIDQALVPGELQYQYNPHYFHPPGRAPQEQEFERLYYVPCAICGRAANDPLCTCGGSKKSRPGAGF